MLDETTETTDTGWMADGLCRDIAPTMFFPSDGVGVERARRICGECPVCATGPPAHPVALPVGRTDAIASTRLE